MTVEHDPRDARPVSSLFSDLVTQVTTLFRTEMRLLRTELSENFGRVSNGAIEIAAGAALLLAALIVLMLALAHALSELGLGLGWASLIVGLGVAAVGGLLVKRGKDNISTDALTPDRTARQLSKDVNLAAEEVR